MFQVRIDDILLIVVSAILIILVALQHAKEGLSDALTGGNSELFKNKKERGAEVYLVRATYVCTIVFMILGLIIYVR